MYLTTKMRADLAYPVGSLARYMANPGPTHLNLFKKVWEYLATTRDLNILYTSEPNGLSGYCDADWGGDIDARRSTAGYIFLLRGSPLSWISRLQRTVALSSCEAEFMPSFRAI